MSTDNVAEPAPQARVRHKALVCSGLPNAVAELQAHLESTSEGRALLTQFELDPTQAFNIGQAVPLLQKGLAGYKHTFAIIAGDFAKTITARDIAAMREQSWAGPNGLVIVGMTDIPAERSRLVKDLGINRVFAPFANVRDDIYPAISGAHREMKELREANTAAQITTQVQKVVQVIHANPREGLFPERAVVVIHAIKGGCGKSTVAANLAWGLSTARPTVLVDFNPDGAFVDTKFAQYLYEGRPGKDKFADRDEMLDTAGLPFLVPSLHHDTSFPVQGDSLEHSLVWAVPDKLALLTGIGDQTDYETAGRITKTGLLLSKSGWISDLINRLRADGPTGFRYVVVDTGTNHYTKFVPMALAAADVICVVIDARDRWVVDAEVRAFRKMLEKNEIPMNAKKILVVNYLADAADDGGYAPKLDTVKEQFEFLNPAAVVSILDDPLTFRRAARKGIPALADASWSDEKGPARLGLKALVNTIAGVYGDLAKGAPAKSKSQGGLFGFLRRR